MVIACLLLVIPRYRNDGIVHKQAVLVEGVEHWEVIIASRHGLSEVFNHTDKDVLELAVSAESI